MNKVDKRYPLPPFTLETALEKIRKAENAWNSKNPVEVSKAYTVDSEWRNRTQFINGREEIIQFLTRKWKTEINYKLKKELGGFRGNRISVRFEFEYQYKNEQWYRAFENELWEFNEHGLMQKRFASINDMKIAESDRTLI